MTAQQLQTQYDDAKDKLQTAYAHTATPPTPAQLTALEPLMANVKDAKLALDRSKQGQWVNDELARLTGGRSAAFAGSDGTSRSGTGGGSWGTQFVAAAGDFIKSGAHRRSGPWESPPVHVGFQATTLTEDPASGGGLVMPTYVPGIVPLPQRPLRVADIFAVGQTASNTLRLMLETLFTNAAAPTAEGTTKAESALVFTGHDEPVRKIAHWIPVSDELLEDAPTVASYIDGRLRLGVLLAEDDQLLSGNGTAPNLLGVLNRPGLTPTLTQTTETIADLIAAQIGAVATASTLAPDAIVLHPNDWLKILTAKDSTGRYLSDNAPFVTVDPPQIWGVSAVITPAIPVKTLLVAAGKQGGQVFRHVSGIRVEATNSHQDLFTKNVLAIRAEERIALAVYRPSAFAKVVLA